MSTPVKPRVLILSSAETEMCMSFNDDFMAALKNQIGDEVDLIWRNYHDIKVSINHKDFKVSLISLNEELKNFDFVYFKSFFRYSELAAVIAKYLDHTNTHYVSGELREFLSISKLSQLAKLSIADLPIIETVHVLKGQWEESFETTAKQLSLPFIFKSTDGSGGRENFLINNKQEMLTALKEFPELEFLAQKYIPNDHDLRILIVGGETKLIIKRSRANGDTHLNNTSQGAKAELVLLSQFSEEDNDIARKAARIMNRQTAGVDIMYHKKTNEPYVLEVNASPQIATGAFMNKKLEVFSEYFKEMARQGQSEKAKKANQPQLIGQTVYVDYPDLNLTDVPARTDTGAKTSAISVSSAKQVGNVLKVKFLDDDTEHTFEKFEKTVVSNSTGHVEKRFKVRLQVIVNGRKIRAWFTLADRSSQVYSVLIGRNLLRGKFIVDVQGKSILREKELERTKLLRAKLNISEK